MRSTKNTGKYENEQKKQYSYQSYWISTMVHPVERKLFLQKMNIHRIRATEILKFN